MARSGGSPSNCCVTSSTSDPGSRDQRVFVGLLRPERQRLRQTLTSGASTLKTLYYAGVMEKEVAAGVTQVRTYLPNGAGVIIETTGGASPGTVVRYFHRDRLGSVNVITNEAGAVVERLGYDAWGRRRNADGTDAATNLTSAIDDTGFTGHEMLDDFGLVYMNGRLYDPSLARVVSADPLVSEADDMQGFNRYGYVSNSPLVYTDPSGFSREDNEYPTDGAFTDQQQRASQLQRVEVTGPRLRTPASSASALGAGFLSMGTRGSGLSAFGVSPQVMRGGVAVPGGTGLRPSSLSSTMTRFGAVGLLLSAVLTSPEEIAILQAAEDKKAQEALGADRPPANPNAPPPDNAYDPDGPKAPGRPTAADGFEPPKGGDQWVKNPNGRGSGRLGSDGRVWVPTGPADQSRGDSHGGPHWDVQTGGRRPSYENIRPVRP